MENTSTRRELLRKGAAATVLLGVGSIALGRAGAARGAGTSYGALGLADANGVRLPAGFSARLIGVTGREVGSTGLIWPLAPDGAATLSVGSNGWMLIANSEDNGQQGGAYVVRFSSNGEPTSAYRILFGTKWNCAGGLTPWGTWLSCEEYRNGLVWECDPSRPGQGVARPALGSFVHEAAPVDPGTGWVYLTEDSYDARLYRFKPTRFGDLSAGQLQAAKVSGTGAVSWVNVPSSSPYRGKETTVFARPEGAWIDQRVVYFATTGDRRVWALDVVTQRLTVVYDAVAVDGPLNGPDNVTVHARTGDLFVAEDASSMRLVQLYQPAAGAEWQAAPFVQFEGHDRSEVAGPTFTPDGSRLYVSSQRGRDGKTGMTFEITGPFHR